MAVDLLPSSWELWDSHNVKTSLQNNKKKTLYLLKLKFKVDTRLEPNKRNWKSPRGKRKRLWKKHVFTSWIFINYTEKILTQRLRGKRKRVCFRSYRVTSFLSHSYISACAFKCCFTSVEICTFIIIKNIFCNCIGIVLLNYLRGILL